MVRFGQGAVRGSYNLLSTKGKFEPQLMKRDVANSTHNHPDHFFEFARIPSVAMRKKLAHEIITTTVCNDSSANRITIEKKLFHNKDVFLNIFWEIGSRQQNIVHSFLELNVLRPARISARPTPSTTVVSNSSFLIYRRSWQLNEPNNHLAQRYNVNDSEYV